jgi:hypothetical protein
VLIHAEVYSETVEAGVSPSLLISEKFEGIPF